jgi:hypothetical protein
MIATINTDGTFSGVIYNELTQAIKDHHITYGLTYCEITEPLVNIGTVEAPDWGSPTVAQLSAIAKTNAKSVGKPYNGFQVPLDEEAQIAVTSVAVMHLAGLFVETVFHFSNGTKMPCTNAEFLAFATWFGTERGAFFTA